MALALSHASKLKPAIRLQQTVLAFESILNVEEKLEFQSCRKACQASPPTVRDVMRLTAEVSRKASSRKSGVGGPVLGPRFTNIIQVAQQFASVGDVLIGASQNLIAAAVWSLVRLTILTLAGFSAYAEKVSELFNAIGRATPRIQELSALYERSKKIQGYVAEYFILVVQLCHRLVRHSRQTTIQQILSVLTHQKIKEDELELKAWVMEIKDEQLLLMAQSIEDIAQGQSTLSKIFSWDGEQGEKQRLLTARVKFMDACSTYDYDLSWRQIRKRGTTGLLQGHKEFREWKTKATSSTLSCHGILGSGKTVLMANIVEDLNLAIDGDRDSVAYFFIRHNDAESLKARTLVGCIARQILETLPDSTWPSKLQGWSSNLNTDKIVQLLKEVLPTDRRLILVIDGVDDWPEHQTDQMMEYLEVLKRSFPVLTCLSLRIEAHHPFRSEFRGVKSDFVLTMPHFNSDIDAYVDSELERRLLSGNLVVGQPEIIGEIRSKLLEGADGMFLWVSLQFDTICDEKTDRAIRHTLSNLPRGLAGTFERILGKGNSGSSSYQISILKFIAGALRSLHVDELRDALSVTPGVVSWDLDRVVNDIYHTLKCCGSLVTVDEEDYSVQFVHQSVAKYLLRSVKQSGDTSSAWNFTLSEANSHLAAVTITYLHIHASIYSEDNKQLETITPIVPEAAAEIQDVANRIIKSTKHNTTRTASIVQKLAYAYMGSRKSSAKHDFGNYLNKQSPSRTPSPQPGQYFAEYSITNWMDHARHLSPSDTSIYTLWQTLVLDADFDLYKANLGLSQVPKVRMVFGGKDRVAQVREYHIVKDLLVWALLNSHVPLFTTLFKARHPIESTLHVIACVNTFAGMKPRTELEKDMQDRLLLFACAGGSTKAIKWLLASGADPLYRNYCALRGLINAGDFAAAEVLLKAIPSPDALVSLTDPLLARAMLKGEVGIALALLSRGAQPELRSIGMTPLGLALRSLNSGCSVPAQAQHALLIYRFLRKGADPLQCGACSRWTARRHLELMTNSNILRLTRIFPITPWEVCFWKLWIWTPLLTYAVLASLIMWEMYCSSWFGIMFKDRLHSNRAFSVILDLLILYMCWLFLVGIGAFEGSRQSQGSTSKAGQSPGNVRTKSK